MSLSSEKITLIQAVTLALDTALAQDPESVILGQDVGKCGGVFRATEGLQKKYGADRVIDTPLAESAIVGCAIGMAIAGTRVIAEIQFSGFVYQAFHQIEQHLARYGWRTRGTYPLGMVLRMPHGGGIHAFEHHSESREAYFLHTPGLKVVMPATPQDAYGLLLSAIEDPDPVIVLEPTRLYRSSKEEIPDTDHRVPIGKAKVLQEGSELTLITYGPTLPTCKEAILSLKESCSIELIDLRTLSPLDLDCLRRSVQKTGRAVIVHEASGFLGLGAELSSQIVETCFLHLKAPIARVTGYDTHIPYFQLEYQYIPSAQRIADAIKKTMQY